MSIKVTGWDPTTGSMKKLSTTGEIDLDGNVNLGDADTDDIEVQGEFVSNLIPNADDTYDLGSAQKGWRHVYSSGVAKLTAIKVKTRDILNGTGQTYALSSDDCVLFCIGDGARTITLPTTSGKAGRVLFIKDVAGNSASNNITITAFSTDPPQQIDGGASYVMATNNLSVIFICDGQSWVLVGKSS